MLRKALRALGFLVYLGLVFVVFLLAAYVSFNLFVRSGATRTPSLMALSLDDARSHLADQGLELRVEEGGRYDSQIPADHVAQQNPPEGTLVKRGSSVTVVPSLGPQRVSVPSLDGQGLQSSQVLLAAAGLSLGRTVEVFGRGVAPGSVVAQEPPAGATVAPGASVDLLLARQGSGETYVMPDLVYRDYEDVRRFFEGRGFRLGSVKYERYEGIRPGVILRQYPVAGHPLGKRDTIALVVAADRQGGPEGRFGPASPPGPGAPPPTAPGATR
jgi:serine/threonine-protein kinase